MDWGELDDEKIAMLNGRCVMNTLAFQENFMTENDLLKCFITSTDKPHDLVEHELKRILNLGVANGFIVRDDDKYGLPVPSLADLNYETDCDDREDDEEDEKPDIMEEKDDATVSSTITIKVGERPKVTARRSIKVEPGIVDRKCGPSTSEAARNLDWSLKVDFFGFTKLDAKRSLANRRARLNFALGKVDFDWNKVIFTSEAMINGVATWGFITDSGPGEMRLINGSMSDVQYVEILNEIVLPFMHQHEYMILMQHKTWIHSSHICRTWFKNNLEARVLDWPPNSEDLDPMNDFWETIDRELESPYQTSRHTMRRFITQCWGIRVMSFSLFYEDMYAGMNQRMQNVIDRHGDK